MRKIIKRTKYKIIKCKKYTNVLNCPKDFFDCFECKHQTRYMKWLSRNLSKEYIEKMKSIKTDKIDNKEKIHNILKQKIAKILEREKRQQTIPFDYYEAWEQVEEQLINEINTRINNIKNFFMRYFPGNNKTIYPKLFDKLREIEESLYCDNNLSLWKL